MNAPLPPDEGQRIRDLYRLNILDTGPEPSFDRITRIASRLSGAPISLISLVDHDRQWFKSRVGLEFGETPREVAFCSFTISRNEPFVILDATKDARFMKNPLVIGGPKIRFYAGAPLKRADGSALGTLCVIDTRPREFFSGDESEILTELAGLVTDQMEQRLERRLGELSRLEREGTEAVRRALQEAIRHAQSLFMAGAEPDSVFEELLAAVTPLTGSKAGCVVNVVTEESVEANLHLRVCASVGEHQLLPLMQIAFLGRTIAEEEHRFALPAFDGDQIVGVVGFESKDSGYLVDMRLGMDSFLLSMVGLFSASRARLEGRQNARAISRRDRALASISSAVSIVDPASLGGAILYVNAAFEAMSGYTSKELVGNQYSMMNGPDTDPRAIALIEDSLATGRDLETTLKNYHRDGTTFLNRVRLSSVRDDSGKVEYFVSVEDDVTAKIAADDELHRAKEAAERHAQVTSQFVANMSHEIRTPMNGVIGMTGLLLDSGLTEEQRDYAETIRSSGEGLLAIINEILDFSRIDAGSVQVDKSEFDLRTCIESAMDVVAFAAARKSIYLEYLVDPGVAKTMIGDLNRLRQVLINLLGNAIKFTVEGSVLLSVSGSRLADGRREINFTVEDTGIGIPASRLADIFMPFQQADNSRTRRYGGTGLGLTISRQLVELMGGRIWVDSQVGRGSSFHFTITVEAVVVSGDFDPACPILPLQGLRVLVLDPNAINQVVLRQHLEEWGMNARIYSSPEVAATQEIANRFDLVIVDNDLPGLTLEQITNFTGDTPMIVLCFLGRRKTGLAAQLRGRSSPRSRLHSKPIKPSSLCETLVAFLSGEPVRVVQESRLSLSDPGFATRLPFAILVVEDNSVNRKLVLLLLSKLGYHADTANNGLEAVTAMLRKPYDVIFMDMHMPEMDGVKATRRIRDLLAEDKQPWIVSLTANAMRADRDVCLRAGMQDFITKPAKLVDLRNALLNVKRKPVIPPTDLGSPCDEEWTIPDYLSDLLAEDHSAAAELLDVFTGDARRQISQLHQALSELDWLRAKKLLHGLSGSCAQMGALGIADRCARLEAEIGSSSLAEIERRVGELGNYHENLFVQMRTLAKR